MIKNRVNGKRYIGESIDIQRRFYQHKNELRKGKHHSDRLQKDWNKYGEKAFRFSVIEYFGFTKYANPNKLKIALLMREGWAMDRYNSIYDYNNEDSIGDLKKFADIGKGNPKFKKYKRYRRWINRHIGYAIHWRPHILVASLYNYAVRFFLYALGGVLVWLICSYFLPTFLSVSVDISFISIFNIAKTELTL